MIRRLHHTNIDVQKILTARGKTPEIPLKTLPYINKRIWGIHPREITVIGARTSCGKTAFALQLAYDIALSNIPVLYLSLEQTVIEMTERIFCNECSVNNYHLLKGNFEEYKSDWESFIKASENIPLVLCDGIGYTYQELDMFFQDLKEKPKVIFLDFIQAVQGASSNIKTTIDEYVKKLAAKAKKEEIAIIVCSQLNRSNPEGDDKTPQLHQLKGSGGLEEYMDCAFLLHWPEKNSDDPRKKTRFIIHIAKNRNGRTGYKEIYFYPQCYKFSEEVIHELEHDLEIDNAEPVKFNNPKNYQDTEG
jgi:replicative DNA helicase